MLVVGAKQKHSIRFYGTNTLYLRGVFACRSVDSVGHLDIGKLAGCGGKSKGALRGHH